MDKSKLKIVGIRGKFKGLNLGNLLVPKGRAKGRKGERAKGRTVTAIILCAAE